MRDQLHTQKVPSPPMLTRKRTFIAANARPSALLAEQTQVPRNTAATRGAD